MVDQRHLWRVFKMISFLSNNSIDYTHSCVFTKGGVSLWSLSLLIPWGKTDILIWYLSVKIEPPWKLNLLLTRPSYWNCWICSPDRIAQQSSIRFGCVLSSLICNRTFRYLHWAYKYSYSNRSYPVVNRCRRVLGFYYFSRREYSHSVMHAAVSVGNFATVPLITSTKSISFLASGVIKLPCVLSACSLL